MGKFQSKWCIGTHRMKLNTVFPVFVATVFKFFFEKKLTKNYKMQFLLKIGYYLGETLICNLYSINLYRKPNNINFSSIFLDCTENILFHAYILVIFYTEILTRKVILWCFVMSEKIHKPTFVIKI